MTMKFSGIGGQAVMEGVMMRNGKDYAISVCINDGFIYVDKHNDGTGDLSRRKKDSFEWYKEVISTNGENIN